MRENSSTASDDHTRAKPCAGVMTSKIQILGSARVHACDASLPPGKQRHRAPGIPGLGQSHERALPVRFAAHSAIEPGVRHSCQFPLRARLSASTRNCRSGDCLNWDMLALWVFVVFSFAALVFAGYVIWVKCDNP